MTTSTSSVAISLVILASSLTVASRGLPPSGAVTKKLFPSAAYLKTRRKLPSSPRWPLARTSPTGR